MPDLLRELLEWFRNRPKTEIALIASAAIVLLMLISRVLYVIAAIVFLVALCSMIVQLVRRQSARVWVAATGVALGMTLLFGFVANTLYGPMIQGQVRAGTLLTAVIALAGIFTGVAANRQARAAENQASMTARSLRVTEQSLREQNERARQSHEIDMIFRLEDRFYVQLAGSRRAAKYIKDNFFANDGSLLEVQRMDRNGEVVLDYFEGLAQLWRLGVLQDESVWYRFGVEAQRYWTLYKTAIKKAREEWKRPGVYKDLEQLAHRMSSLDH